jgi:flavin reductase (DIM6/NTAB) family NADH-FMN oxidoreductase RutF
MHKITFGPQTWLFPMPALVIGALVDGKPNFMTAAWGGMACAEPRLLSVAIRTMRLTLQGIREHKAFSVNIPGTNLADKVDFCGVHSGKKTDKSKIFSVWYGQDKTVPLIEECPCAHECRVERLIELGSHVLVIGEIRETHVDEACLKDNMPDIGKMDPLAYLPGVQRYGGLGRDVRQAFSS